MKTSDRIGGGRIDPAHFRSFAEYLARFIEPYREEGIDSTESSKVPANIAFRNPDGSHVLVAANPESRPRDLTVSVTAAVST